jgi:hypothetical protein
MYRYRTSQIIQTTPRMSLLGYVTGSRKNAYRSLCTKLFRSVRQDGESKKDSYNRVYQTPKETVPVA